MILKLTHIVSFPHADCRIGVLEDGRGFKLYVLDPLNGIPNGEYSLIPYASPEHGPTWCFHNPDLGIYAGAALGYPKPADDPNAHDYIEFHVGNDRDDTEDCNLVGEVWEGKPYIKRSQAAMALLRGRLGPLSKGHVVIVSGRDD